MDEGPAVAQPIVQLGHRLDGLHTSR